ncbi:putative hydro-lyase [Phaeobacter sp. JH20_36]|uniref:putative hydro-lyase n=1 Tax=Phaeobacter sp. JH20_12 TaxID=3112471 RepID=UPI003A840957
MLAQIDTPTTGRNRTLPISHAELVQKPLAEIRDVIRRDSYHSHTAGLGNGFLQANIAIMPSESALDFMRYCQRNPKPCPLTGVSDTGNPKMFTMGRDIDIRTDVPAYNIYRDGKLESTVGNIRDIWHNDLVAFALGCSFTFEHALNDAGIQLWHINNNKTVPMFRTSIETVPSGPFGGPMVVSMRAIPEDQLKTAIAISKNYPLAHGAPVHWGDPAEIGIQDVNLPDWGDPAPVEAGFIPVFWACGVTPQAAIEQAKLPLCITHKPGHMLITDIPQDAENPILAPDNHQSN